MSDNKTTSKGRDPTLFTLTEKRKVEGDCQCAIYTKSRKRLSANFRGGYIDEPSTKDRAHACERRTSESRMRENRVSGLMRGTVENTDINQCVLQSYTLTLVYGYGQ